jgi:hypothetical protein
LCEAAGNRDITDEEIDNMSFVDRSRLIAQDPVTCARYFDRRVTNFMKVMVVESDVLGDVTDYAGVDEFQARGTPHLRILLWCKDAPVYGQHTDEAVKAFLKQYISTDSSSVLPEHAAVQSHQHSNRCGGRHKDCSYGFPHPPMPNVEILVPLGEEEICAEDRLKSKADMKLIKNRLRQVNVALKFGRRQGNPAAPEQEMDFPAFLASLSQQNPDENPSPLPFTYERYILAMRSRIDRPTVFHKRHVRDIMINPFNRNILGSPCTLSIGIHSCSVICATQSCLFHISVFETTHANGKRIS